MRNQHKRIASLLLLTLLVLLSRRSFAQGDVRVQQGIHYGESALQTVDVYSTEHCRRNRCPVVMWVHGGGWRHGDTGNSRARQMQEAWARQGIVMVGVNYRLSPAVMHPAHVQDVAAAIDWVHRNIGNYGGNAKRISLLGHSAGAHLVALVTTNPAYLGAYQLDPAAVIDNVFPIDTASFDLTDEASPFIARIVGDAFGSDPNVLRDASPTKQVRSGGSYPAFIIAATANRPDAVRTSNALLEQLHAAGGCADLIVKNYPGARQLRAHALIAEELGDMNSDLTRRLLRQVTDTAPRCEIGRST